METIFKHRCSGTHRQGRAWARCAFPGVPVFGSGTLAVFDRDPTSGAVRHVTLYPSPTLAKEQPVKILLSCPHFDAIDSLRGTHVVGQRCRTCDTFIPRS